MLVNSDTELLDIAEAAALLGVSETSLRRWTNAGRLACLRVGARRERRFRRADLLAFLEEQPARSEAEPVSIAWGTHLCGVYSTDDGQVALAAGFLAETLRPGTAGYLLLSPAAQRSTMARLGTGAGPVVLTRYASTPEAQLEFFERSFTSQLRAGAVSFVVVGDASEAIAGGMGAERLGEYEAAYDRRIARRFPVVTLCMYDARRYSGLELLDTIRAHPDCFRYPVERLTA